MRNLINNELMFVSGGNGEELRVSTTEAINYKIVYNEADPIAAFRVARLNDSIAEPVSAYYNQEDVA